MYQSRETTSSREFRLRRPASRHESGVTQGCRGVDRLVID